MILKKLVLHNYKQHAHQEIDISGHLIGVVGRNGSGKSNLLGALQFGFGGEQPGSKREDLLSWGAAAGHVDVFFEHAGIPGKIHRDLHANKASFTFGDDDYNGITKVADGIQNHMGLDKELLRQAIFVRQAEIDSILFTDPRVRELSFQKLCGIGEATKIHKRLGDVLTTISLPPDYDTQIAESKQRHTEMHERLRQLKDAHAQATATRGQCPTQEQFQAQLGNYETLRISVQQYADVLVKIKEYADRITANEASVVGLTVPEGDIGELDVKIEETNKLIADMRQYQQVASTWETAGKALIELGEAPQAGTAPCTAEQVEELRKTAETLSKQYNEVMGNYSFYADLIETMGTKLAAGMDCPLCGGQITDTGRLLVLLQEAETLAKQFDYRPAATAATEAGSALAQFERGEAKTTADYAARHAALLTQYQQTDAALKALTEPAGELTELAKSLETAKAVRNLLLSSTTTKTKLETTLVSDREHVAQLDVERKSYLERLSTTPDVMTALEVGTSVAALEHIQERITTLTASLAEVQQLDQQQAQLTGMTNELETNLAMLEKAIGELEHKRAQQGSHKEALKVIEDVRSWFHYNNGPHTLSSRVLGEMTEDVNNFLGQFAAPFSVVHGGETLGFQCQFHDGRAMPEGEPPDAAVLSGGEKIQLAISFRFGSYCMFASKLGLLSLDEPTVYLDDNNVGRFCTLLQKIKEVAQKMNLQVLIATHERAVMPFMDTVIDLSSETAQ